MLKIEVAKPVAKSLKVLLYGPSGSGKTIAALTFPRVLLVDAESGSDLYAGRPGVAEFHRTRIKTTSELDEVIQHVEKDAGRTYGTLVIDPISVFYAVEKNAKSANDTKQLGFREWSKINNRMNSIYNRLTSLNIHVVLIAREAVEYAGEDQNLKKVGVKPDADKNLVYSMDFVVRLTPDHAGIVEKSRGVTVGQNGRLQKVDWSVFEPISNLYVTGERQQYEDDEQAAAREADNLGNRDVAEEFMRHWYGQSLTNSDVLAALRVSRISEWQHGRAAADKAVQKYLAEQMDTPKAQPKHADASH